MLLIGGFSVAMGQLVGMGSLIYIFYSWDVIEPVTYMVGTWWAVVGMSFYLRYRNDFEYGSVHDMFKAKKFDSLCREKGIDQK